MRRTALVLAALSSALAAVPTQAEPVVLKPSSPWNVDFAADQCRLTRLFGTGEDQHYLSFQQYWPGDRAGLTVAGPAFKKFRSLERTAVRFFEAQEPLKSTPFTGSVETFGTGVIFSSIALDEADAETDSGPEPLSGGVEQMDLALGKQVQFVELRQGSRDVRLDTGPLDEPFAVLNQCSVDLLREWGLDAERHLTALSRPRWINEESLVRRITADYPADALAKGEQAIMRMRLIISAEGTVESCTMLKATKTIELESRACKVMERAQFEPARDAAGQPFRSYYATSITYRLG